MGLRETINNHVGIVAGATIVAAIIGGYVAFRQISDEGRSFRIPKAYFTVDDGKTYFSDDSRRLPPFQWDGKEAVKAYVFVCNGREVVAWLEKYTPEYKTEMEKAQVARSERRPVENIGKMMSLGMGGGRLLKKPGEMEWRPTPDGPVGTLKCVDGKVSNAVVP